VTSSSASGPVPAAPTFGPAAPTSDATVASAAPGTSGTGAPAGAPTGPAAVPSSAVGPTAPDPAPSRPLLREHAAGTATPAPEWLGTRALGPAGNGPVAPKPTPPELLDRRIVTRDLLPPPPDEQFASSATAVPDDVLTRSTWRPGCPVGADDLRYVQVAFWGFDGRPHTGEVLVHRDAVDAVTAAFRAMHAERFPLEEVRIVRAEELTAAPTGDGNVTSAFVCRPAAGSGRWSEHAYGRALDVNPFHNPYVRGEGAERVVIPELATAYTDRDRVLPGMLSDGSAAVRAFRAAGWTWGGDYSSLQDWQHFSASGR
jgi:hypothetical protein